MSLIPEAVYIPPKPDLNMDDADSVRMYKEFYENLPGDIKTRVYGEVFNDANKKALIAAVKTGFKDWANTF